MDLFSASERLMAMDDAAWRRHANPWSVYTRLSCLPLIALSIYSRAVLGWWALVPLALALGWTLLNPRVFPAPARTDGWASKGTFGERIFLNRRAVPIPERHARMAAILTSVSVAGLAVMAWGLVVLDPWAAACGVAVAILAKLWFVDRMVWLYEDMAPRHPAYAAWPK